LEAPALLSPAFSSSFFFLCHYLPTMAEPGDQAASDLNIAENELFEAARGKIYVSDGIKDIDPRRDHDLRFKSLEEVRTFLRGEHRQQSVGHTYGDGYISLLLVPIKDEATASVAKSHLRSVLPLRSKTMTNDTGDNFRDGSTTNSIWVKRFGNLYAHTLLEPPKHSVPYFYLSLASMSSEAYSSTSERGILMYSANHHCFDSMARSWPIETEPTISGQKHPHFALVYTILLPYIDFVVDNANKVDAKIRHIKTALDSRDISTLSDLFHELNSTSHDIKISELSNQITFAKRAASKACDGLLNTGYEEWGIQLSEASKALKSWDKVSRENRVAELRLHAADVGDELRQKREENWQKWEEERQKREDARQEREEQRATKEGELLEESIRIAKETKRDSRTMRGIAWVTIAFLPATFVSSFFGMNFFNGIAGNVPFDGASRNVWLFFAIAMPISGIVLFIFYFWDEYERKKDEKKVDGEKSLAVSL
jgi:hypothetical protein